MEIKDGAPAHAGIPAQGIGELHLQPGVQDVLELFIIGAVLVGLVHAQPEGALAHLPDALYPLLLGRDFHPIDQGISGVQKARGIQGQGLVPGLHHQAHKAEGADPEGLIGPLFARGIHHVGQAQQVKVLPVVPLALERAGIGAALAQAHIGFGIGEVHPGAQPALHIQEKVGGLEHPGVQIHRIAAMGGQGYRAAQQAKALGVFGLGRGLPDKAILFQG